MKPYLASLIAKTNSNANESCPTFYRLSILEDKQHFQQIINSVQNLQVYDEIQSQVEELIKSRNPKTIYSKEKLTYEAATYLEANGGDNYGVWVYYPWSNKLVHMLDEDEFVFVRTNRNQYKITPHEKSILATKKIGILGLSVGQSIALTIAMERSCGELRIADFDVLELSNLNRIRTGVHNLGIAKTIAVAREIAEIDPFLKVTCFHSGATEENIDDFITKNGKLDIIVDECDGLLVKILCRQKAKHYQIPVVMDTSDRGMVDIERFDLEPNRSILHGYIDHLNIDEVKNAKTNEEKVPYLLPMLGLDTLSSRMKASMLEIEQTITTWPQLASSVVLGGALGADVCRRILLDQLHVSGRFFMDVEELISDENDRATEKKELFVLRPSLSDDDMNNIIKTKNDPILKEQIDVDPTIIKEIVKAATLAPTGANIQPWKWVYNNKNLYLFFDDRYSAGLLDCQNTTTFVGFGAATENLVLKAHELGLEVIAAKEALTKDSKLICIYKFFEQIPSEIKTNIEPHVCDELAEIIPLRLTNRNIGKRVAIEKNRLEKLITVAQTIPGANLKLIYDEELLEEVKTLTAVMDRIRVTHKGGHTDYLAEIRWTPEEALLHRNGVDLLGTVDLTPSELAGWKVIKDWNVIQHLNDWGLGKAMEKIQIKSIEGSSAVGLLTMPKFSSNDFYEGGRAFQRIWLAANKDNICVHPASLSTLIFNTYNYGDKSTFPDKMRKEISETREKFEKLFSIEKSVGEIILFRFFIGAPPKSRSVRYPLEQVLKFT